MKYKILLVIFAICLFAAAMLSLVPTSKICGVEENSCSVVANSGYQKTLGISNSYMGLVAFLALIILTMSHMFKPKKEKEIILIAGIIIASIAAAYLIYIQLFVIKAICKYCMIVDLGSILALIVILIYGRD